MSCQEAVECFVPLGREGGRVGGREGGREGGDKAKEGRREGGREEGLRRTSLESTRNCR